MANEEGSTSTFGGRISERLANTVIRAMVDTKGRLAPEAQRLAMSVFTEATNHVSDEVRAWGGSLFRKLATDPGTDDELRPLLHALGNTRGQAAGWIAGALYGTAMGVGLGDLLTNYMSVPVGKLISENPNSLLSPEQAAAADLREIAYEPDFGQEAAKKGINGARFGVLRDLQKVIPPTETVIGLLQRKVLTPNEAAHMLKRQGVWDEYINKVLLLAHNYLSPQETAAAWARNARTTEQVHQNAALFGLDERDADALMELAGEPPPLDAVIAAWRRAIMTEADVDRAIVQGPIRNEWIPAIKALQYQVLPPEQAAISVTQGHLSFEQGMAKAALSGITEDDFRTVVDNAGLPPGIDFAAEALARGKISIEEWRSMFLESRIKNKWIPVMESMLTKLIPADTVRLAYRLGVYPLDAAVQTLKGHGFTEVDARAQLAIEDARKHESTKDLSRAQVVALYEEEIIPSEVAQQMLDGLGYDQQEIDWQLALADLAKVRRFVNALVAKVHNAWIAASIPDEEAMTLLTEAGVGTQARDSYMALWTLEREALSANLTTAQIQAAIKRQLLTDGEAQARFVKRGYSDRDAQILVALAHPA